MGTFEQKGLNMTSLDLLNGDPSFQRFLLADLSETAKAAFTRIWELESGPAILRLFRARPRTLMTADDIAFRLGESPQLIERDLKSLVRLGIVRMTRIPNFTVYGLATEGQPRLLAQEIGTWQDRWEARLSKMRHIVLGQREDRPNADAVSQIFSS